MKFKYIVTFVLLELTMLFIVKIINLEDTKKLLINTTSKLENKYDEINLHFDQIAYLVFNGYVNQDDILEAFANRDRKKLFNTLNKNYTYMKKINFAQLHFHLPNNESFLRFHKPNKYGDNLSSFRYTVSYVNKNKKEIHGLEMGKITPGFRYVYPLYYQGKYIGSVENSLSMLAFINQLKKINPIHAHFIMKKSIVDKKIFEFKKNTYIQSVEAKDYYEFEMKTVKEEENNKKEVFSKKYKKIVEDGINTNKSFSFILKDKTITFLQQNNVKNEHLGYFIIYQNNKEIQKIEEHLIKKSIMFTFILVLLILIIYINSFQKSLLEKKVIVKTKELDTLNKFLITRIDEELKKALLKEKELNEASRMVQMGEMIGNIAHQWRQPLSVITTIASSIRINLLSENINKNNIDKNMIKINDTAQYLSKIIDTFRNFLNEKKELKEQLIEDNISSALDIVGVVLKDVNIKLIDTVNYEDKTKLTIVSGELPEVIINIINNAKDVLLEKKLKNKWVKINSFKNDKIITITIEDNAGGIPENIINKIFDVYFTTKHKSLGTGLGLHMSKRIVNESLHGELYVKNTQNGAKFYIEIPLEQ